jgi:hypothetical protein
MDEARMSHDHREDIEGVSQEALDVFSAISTDASSRLDEPRSSAPHTLASVNTFTSIGALKSLNEIEGTRRRSLELLTWEPAIARVEVRTETGSTVVYYICRDSAEASPGADRRLAGRNTPIGRLASLDVGEEFEIRTPGGVQSVEIVGKTILHPSQRAAEWDSRDSIFYGDGHDPITIISMLDFLATSSAAEHDTSLLDSILADDERATNIIEGIRRNVITKMGLRDQPVLDRYQDEIFRLPLNSQLLIIGPPGTGKTTTLIRRLGQKLDKKFLDDDELKLAEGSRSGFAPEHADSWLMFTPTELLKQYLKEAFAREGIAAPDQRVTTWSRFRLELARNRFRILRASNGGGPFIMKEGVSSIRPEVLQRQTEWYEDFAKWQAEDFWRDLSDSAETLKQSDNTEVSRLGRSVDATLAAVTPDDFSYAILSLVHVVPQAMQLLQVSKKGTDGAIHRNLSLQVNRNRKFLEELAVFLDGLNADEEETDDSESDDDDDMQLPRTRIAAAAAAYTSAIRSLARAHLSGRNLGKNSRAGKIVAWLGDRIPPDTELRELGINFHVQIALRKFTNPIQRYFFGVPAGYRRFRRARQAEGLWYIAGTVNPSEVDSLEVDVMLLCTLRSAAELTKDRTVLRTIDDPVFGILRDFSSLVRNQVVVDEATDFSPLQLACMGAISNPAIRSFFACGDFNQRITIWGSRSADEMKWVFPKIDVRPIQVSYRHSKQLSHLAKEIVRLCEGETIDVALPKHVDSVGVAPVLGVNLAHLDEIVDWLAKRVIEIERFTSPLPSVAILVNDEAEVGPLAAGLKAALAGENLNVVPCYNGQFSGQDNDIRIFDVQHIKGLEFEAVFFVGVDRLATLKPELFDKYLYVGATRAATYLGLTCCGDSLPQKIESLQSEFSANWHG